MSSRPEIFEEYTRRQYHVKASQRNPFGDEDEPIKFGDLDISTRIKVLHQLSTWTLGNVDRIRGLMPEDEDHLNWRIEPIGWDKEDRAYYVCDDNRLYRRSDEVPLPLTPKPKPKSTPKPKSKSKKPAPRKGTRSSKRRKLDESEDEEAEEPSEVDETMMDDNDITNGDITEAASAEEPGYGFTSKTWECIAVTLEDYQEFMASIFRSRDSNEKQLRKRLEEDVMPIIEKRADAIRQKQLKKLRELENLQKMATAKRSSRLQDKAEREAKEQEDREAEEKHKAELRMAHEEQEKQKRIEEGHESRRLTREQRVREREAKRILHQEELARLEEEAGRADSQGVDGEAADAKRASDRQRQTQKEQHKKELEQLAEEDGNWYFDCSVCGQHGDNMDDGTHSIACDRCNVWQHSKCHGFTPKQAEHNDFIFVCSTCKRKEEDAKKPKLPTLKLHHRPSTSPDSKKATPRPVSANGQHQDVFPPNQHTRPSPASSANGLPFPHNGSTAQQPHRMPPVGNFAPQSQPQPAQQWNGSPQPAYQNQPHLGNGQQHYAQHHYAHHNAVASAGGHPPYNQQYAQQAPQQANGHGGPPGPNAYPSPYQQPYPQYQQHQQPYQQYAPPAQWQQYNHAPHHQGPLANGFQSPVKAPASKPTSSSPPQYSGSPSQSHGQPALQQSPRTNLPPPSQTRPSQSPVKSSPSSAYQQQDHRQQLLPPDNAPKLAQNNGHSAPSPQFQTPQMRGPSATGASPHANHVAADGMSGPWPQATKVIPEKHDQSPAPPPSSHVIGEKTVFPPATPLAPSPGQQTQQTGTIPVKKMQTSPPATIGGNVGGGPTFSPKHQVLQQAPQQSAPPMIQAHQAPDMDSRQQEQVPPGENTPQNTAADIKP